ncbi:MAG: hypothetical protein RIR09_2474, partial [Pseudomonadota bacterium]
MPNDFSSTSHPSQAQSSLDKKARMRQAA